MVVHCKLDDEVVFEPVSNVTNVFFDDKNQQVFSVRSGGATGIIIKGFKEQNCSTFRLEDQGPIISIKLSPDQKILAVQRSKAIVQFVGVKQTGSSGILDTAKEFSQGSKSKSATILGFYWLSNSEIMYLTSLGIEIYGVIHDKRTTKNVKQLNQSIHWFAYSPRSGVLVVSTSAQTSTLQPFLVKASGGGGSHITKLPKIDLSLAAKTSSEVAEVRENSVGVITLYHNRHFVSVICHQVSSSSQQQQQESSCNSSYSIHLYRVSTESPFSVERTHVFHTPFGGSGGGGLALNVVDNLLIAHHQSTGVSAFFDVALLAESDGHILHHQPIGAPFKVTCASDRQLSGSSYPPNWVMLSPNIVIDAKLGVMWRLKNKLNLNQLKKSAVVVNGVGQQQKKSGSGKSEDFADLPRLVSFLLQRDKAKMMLLDVMLDWCDWSSEDDDDDDLTSLKAIGESFDLINRDYRSYLDNQIQSNLALSTSPFYSTTAASLRSSAGGGATGGGISSSQSCRDFSQYSAAASASVGGGGVASAAGGGGTSSSASSSSFNSPSKRGHLLLAKVILDQSDLYSYFFTPLLERACCNEKAAVKRGRIQRLISILLEYSRSLEEQHIPVQHFLNEVLVDLLVQNEAWYQLHQLLQYHVISDSKPLACLLLSLESVYPAAGQLALDMLTRLRNSAEEICEILLSKNRVLSALQYASDRGLIHTDSLKARKFLDAAHALPDEEERRVVFHSTFTFLAQRGLLQRGGGSGGCFDEYATVFKHMFSSNNDSGKNSSINSGSGNRTPLGEATNATTTTINNSS